MADYTLDNIQQDFATLQRALDERPTHDEVKAMIEDLLQAYVTQPHIANMIDSRVGDSENRLQSEINEVRSSVSKELKTAIINIERVANGMQTTFSASLSEVNNIMTRIEVQFAHTRELLDLFRDTVRSHESRIEENESAIERERLLNEDRIGRISAGLHPIIGENAMVPGSTKIPSVADRLTSVEKTLTELANNYKAQREAREKWRKRIVGVTRLGIIGRGLIVTFFTGGALVLPSLETITEIVTNLLGG